MSNRSEDRVTIWLSEPFRERVDDRVDWRYGSRSNWIREAIQYRMYVDDALDQEGLALPEDDGERKRMLRAIAWAGVEAYDEDLLSKSDIEEMAPDDGE